MMFVAVLLTAIMSVNPSASFSFIAGVAMTMLVSPLLLFCVFADDSKPAPKLPDYEALLNEKLGKGITSEKNANVLLWKAFGPKPEGGTVGMPAQYFKLLGIAEPPNDGNYFIGLTKYMKDHLKLDPNEFTPLFDQQGWAGKAPWTAKDYPHIAGWLKANEKPLAIVIEATKRTEYFNPLVSRRNENERGSLIGALLPSVQKCRELAVALTARAMLQLAEGKEAEAWQDLLACHRLARLTARGATLIEELVGIAVDAVASNADMAYLENAKLTAKQIQDRIKDLQSLPAMPSMADKIDIGERHMGLDALQLIQRGGGNGLLANGNKKTDPEELKGLAMLDWEGMTRDCNAWYDRMAEALRLKDRAAREKAFDKLDRELAAAVKEGKDFQELAKQLQVPGADVKAVSKSISNVLMSLLSPAIRKVQGAHDRAEAIQANLQVAFALAAYKADNGKYPAKLDDLAPKYLATIPGDIFSGKALIYKPSEKGFLVYSVGANGKDDDGRWTDDMPPGDDPRVRLPLPPLKKN
jgi:hypothetical protein